MKPHLFAAEGLAMHDGSSGAATAMKRRKPRAMRVYSAHPFKKSPFENAALMRKFMAEEGTSAASDATGASVPSTLGAPITLKISTHIVDTVGNLQKLCKSNQPQSLLLSPFKNMQISGLSAEALADFQKGAAFLAPEKIVIDKFFTNGMHSNLFVELVGVSAKPEEARHPSTGALALRAPVATLLEKGGMISDLGTLYDRPHNADTARFIQGFGSSMCSAEELAKTYTHLKDNKTLVYADTAPYVHYMHNTNAVFQFKEEPLATGEHLTFNRADAETLLQDLQDTWSASAAVLDKNMKIRVSTQSSCDLKGDVQPGRFFAPSEDVNQRFELILEGTIDARLLSMADGN